MPPNIRERHYPMSSRAVETIESLDKASELIRAGTADFDFRKWHRPPPVSYAAALSSSEAHQLAGWKGRLLMERGGNLRRRYAVGTVHPTVV
jgi:hypothetical protein